MKNWRSSVTKCFLLIINSIYWA